MALITPKINAANLTSGTLNVSVFPANTIIKSVTFRPSYSSELTVNANADVEWWSQTFDTVRANSRILITYHSGQINLNTTSADGNPRIYWSCNSTSVGTGIQHHRDHNHEWYNVGGSSSDKRIFISGQATTNSLSIGTHTIRAFAGAYNQQLTFFHQGSTPNRLPIITFQEIAA